MGRLRRNTLQFLVEFFLEVVSLEADNKMTSYNIAVTVGPCLFRSKVARGEDIYKHAVYYDAMIKMMEFYEHIFKDEPLRRGTAKD